MNRKRIVLLAVTSLRPVELSALTIFIVAITSMGRLTALSTAMCLWTPIAAS